MLLFHKQIYTNLVLLNTVAEEIILNQFNKTNQYVFSANYLQNNFLNDFTNRYFFYIGHFATLREVVLFSRLITIKEKFVDQIAEHIRTCKYFKTDIIRNFKNYIECIYCNQCRVVKRKMLLLLMKLFQGRNNWHKASYDRLWSDCCSDECYGPLYNDLRKMIHISKICDLLYHTSVINYSQ